MPHFFSKNQRFLTPIFTLVMGGTGFGDVTLPSIINDHMVVQSGTLAPIWGWADAGENVTVSFAGQTKSARATKDGKWMVKLDPLAVSTESRTMRIKGNNEIELDDVLVGEVWLASGQSNMEFGIGGIPDEEKKVAFDQSNNRLLRMFCAAPKVTSPLPLKEVAGYWSDCSYFIEKIEEGKIKGPDSHSAVGFFFGLKLQNELKVPVAVIDSSWGGTSIETWISDEGYEMEGLKRRELPAAQKATAASERDALEVTVAAWNEAARTAVDGGDPVSMALEAPRNKVPNGIYNGMIAPLAPFSIKGVIWYQGEANRGSKDYFEKLKALTGGWAKAFNVEDIPFYLVQLAPYNYAHDKSKGVSEQIIYDSVVSAQYKATDEIKGCDMVTISDTVFGNVKNVHPPHKKAAGDRLAALALHYDYAKSVIYSGPRLAKATAKGNIVTVAFDRIDQGLETSDGKAPNWFEIAGADQKFVTAIAKIKGDTVVVTAAEVAAPKFIRLGWNNIAELNLRDENGWPVFSFNTTIEK